jgi:hypothetical protein
MKLTSEQIKRFRLVETKRTFHRTTYQANLGWRSPRIKVETTGWFIYIDFQPPLFPDDELEHFDHVAKANLGERLGELYRSHKARHKRLRAIGNECFGGWWYCDRNAAEAVLGLLVDVFKDTPLSERSSKTNGR